MQLRIKQQCNVRHAPWKGTIGQFDWAWLWSLGLLGALGLLGLGTAQAQVAPLTPMTHLSTNDVRPIDTTANTIMKALSVQGSPPASGQLLSQALPAPPVCDIQLNKTTYVNGDTVIAQVLQIANPTTVEIPVEIKIWVDIAPPAPLIPPASIVNIGSDGSVKLPPGFITGVIPLLQVPVTAALPRGTYGFNCRMLHPVTKEFFTEDVHSFAVQ